MIVGPFLHQASEQISVEVRYLVSFGVSAQFVCCTKPYACTPEPQTRCLNS